MTESASSETVPGSSIIRASLAGTGLFGVVAAFGASDVDRAGNAMAGVSFALFGIGILCFLIAFAKAVDRSRHEAIGIGGLFFLAGETAPPAARRVLLASLAVEVVVAFVAAGLRPYTVVAFGILVPMYGLGLAGLWGARHGSFEDRIDQPPRTSSAGSRPETAG